MVMVEAPETTFPSERLERRARVAAARSTPPCLLNEESSAAMTASTSRREMEGRGLK